MTDAIASPANIDELVSKACLNMGLLGVFAFCAFYIAYYAVAKAASRIANKWRVVYLESVLRQDAAFFDSQEQGTIALSLAEGAMDIQSALGDKFAAASQGVWQLVAGFAVAFYFGPILSLMILIFSPALVVTTYFLTTYGSEDGIFGKEAYESAASIATETIANIRTVVSMNVETTFSKKYDSKLKQAETAAIKQGTGMAVITGMLFLVMFGMYGFGFWYGAKLIADSTDTALKDHPIPTNFWNETAEEWKEHRKIVLGENGEPGACSDYTDVDAALDVCACGINWNSMDYESPKCGCGYYDLAGGYQITTECFTGGKTMLVFFSILIGAFGLGTAGPFSKAIGEARVSAAKMLKVIDRVPDIDISAAGKKMVRSEIRGALELNDVHFHYNLKSGDPQRVRSHAKPNKIA